MRMRDEHAERENRNRCIGKIGAAVMIAVLFLCGACGGNPKEQGMEENGAGDRSTQEMTADKAAEGTSLYEHGLEVVARMAEMAGSEAYVELYTSNSELAELLSSVGDGDFSEPLAVYRVRAKEGVASILDLAETGALSDELRAVVESKLFSTLATQINNMEGTTALAAASLCTAEKLFVSGELTENEIYLYVYENAAPVAVTFMMGEDGAVAARGMFILYEGFEADRLEEMEGFWERFGVWVERVGM